MPRYLENPVTVRKWVQLEFWAKSTKLINIKKLQLKRFKCPWFWFWIWSLVLDMRLLRPCGLIQFFRTHQAESQKQMGPCLLLLGSPGLCWRILRSVLIYHYLTHVTENLKDTCYDGQAGCLLPFAIGFFLGFALQLESPGNQTGGCTKKCKCN